VKRASFCLFEGSWSWSWSYERRRMAAKKAGIYSKEKAPTTYPSTSLLSHFL